MDDKLERILDEGITSYSGREPLTGLPERILARISAEGRPARRMMGWQVACGVAVAVAALLLVLRPYHETLVARTVRITSREMAPHAVATFVVQPVRVARRSRRKRILPKLEVFPTPSPLTVDERGLLALTKRDPEEIAAALESARKPLEIEELVIQPLGQ